MIGKLNLADTAAANMNPIGRLFDDASNLICIPTSLDQKVGQGLSAQASAAKFASPPTNSVVVKRCPLA